MRRIAIALLLIVFDSNVMAANWMTLEDSREKGFEIAIDLDSIRPGTEGARHVEVTWHQVFQGSIRSEYDSMLDCAEISITHKVWRIPFGKDTIANEFSKPSDRKLRYVYPSWRTAHLFRNICPRFNLNWKEQWVTPRPTDACQSPKSLYEKRLCSGNHEALGEYNLMVHRLAQLQPSCSITEELYAKIAGFFYDLLTQCSDESCLHYEIENGIFFEMGKSLQASKAGEKCTFVDYQLTRIEMASKKNQEREKFQTYIRCWDAAIPLLDDGVSGAETVGFAVHAKCKAVLDSALAQSDNPKLFNAIVEKLQPDLVARVLQYRAAKRQLQEIERRKPPRKSIRPDSQTM